jgi:hypothetical protein
MPLTFGAATATLFVMGAILVGPAWTECAGQEGFGSCLRQGLEERGLLAPRPPQFAEMPALPRFDPRPEGQIAVDVAEASAIPAVPVALEGLRGGIDTSLTMQVAPVVTTTITGGEEGSLVASRAGDARLDTMGAELVATGGAIAARAADGLSLQAADVVLRAQDGVIVASGDLRPGLGHTGVTLAPEPVVLSADAVEPASQAPVAAGLTGAPGAMSVAGSVAVSAAPAIARLSSNAGMPSAGSEGAPAGLVSVDMVPLAVNEPVTLDAAAELPSRAAAAAAILLPVEPQPAPPMRKPQPDPAPPAIAPEPVGPQFVYDPAFPNVILLPPPQQGENSSIQTLQLD